MSAFLWGSGTVEAQYMDGQLAQWMSDYVKAWNSNDPDDIAALFTEDAEYYTEPYTAPWQGRETIVREWLENKDEPGDTQFMWQPMVVTDELVIVQGRTIYRSPPRTYSNLWVIRFDAMGHCREFTEWWMEYPA
jgi:uncharacterized protein (TIGR02246 family)